MGKGQWPSQWGGPVSGDVQYIDYNASWTVGNPIKGYLAGIMKHEAKVASSQNQPPRDFPASRLSHVSKFGITPQKMRMLILAGVACS